MLAGENQLAAGSEVLPTSAQNENGMDVALVPEDEVKPPDVVSNKHRLQLLERRVENWL